MIGLCIDKVRPLCLLWLVACLTLGGFVSGATAGEPKLKPEDVVVSTGDVDTAYRIIKVMVIGNRGTYDEAKQENEADLRAIAANAGCNAAIFAEHYTSRVSKDSVYTDAILVKYLNAKEIEKRLKKTKPPPVLKKVDPLDPEPMVVELGDVEYAYDVIGVINIRSGFFSSQTEQSLNADLVEKASHEGANGVLFVEYLRAEDKVLGAVGVMVKFKSSWEKPKK